MQIRTCAHACLRAHKQTRAALLDASPNPSLRLENTGEVRRQAMLCWAAEAVKWCCWAYVLSGLVLTVFGVDEIYHKCHNHIINTMAPQPRLQEIWYGVIFEVSDEVNKHWNIIPKLGRQKYTDSWDIDKNNRKRERYEWWMGEVHVADAHRNPGGAFPLTLFRVCVHLFVWWYVKRNSGTRSCVGSRVITYLQRGTTRKQQLLCEHVCLCEVEKERAFWQALLPYSPSLILPFLSPPIIWLHIR